MKNLIKITIKCRYLFSIVAVAAIFFLTVSDYAIAFRSVSRAAVRSIKSAVSQNIKQAVKPSFNVRSRYSKSMLSIAFSRNGQYFATVSGNGSAQLWDVQTGQKIINLRHANDSIVSVAFSLDSSFIATGSKKGVISLWNIDQNKIQSTVSAHSALISSMIEVPHQGWLTASADGGIRLIDINSGVIKRYFYVNGGGAVFSITVNHKGDRLISGHDDGKIRIWNLFTGQNTMTIDGKGGAVYSTDISSDDVLAAGLDNGYVKLWNLHTGRKIMFEKRHDAPVRALAISHDSTYIATGSDDNSIKISLLGNNTEMTLAGHEGSINSICFNNDNNFLLTASSDKTSRFWSWRKEKKEAARLVVMREGWAVVTPEGFFDGTLDGDIDDRLESIQWTVGNSSFSVDGFMERYYEPALLGQVLQGKSIFRDEAIEAISEGFSLPPLMKISISSLSESNAGANGNKVHVVVEAVDQGGGINEIRLYHNNKALGDSNIQSVIQKKDKPAGQTKTYKIYLLEGINFIKAVGFSNNRIESVPVEKSVEFTYPQKEIETTLHVVSIGINKYKNPALDLNFAVPDAKNVLEGIEQLHSKVFDVFNFYELYDGDATLNNINTVLKSLSVLPPQDTLVIYFAGHGKTYENNWYFIPYDLYQPDNHSELVKKGISSSELIPMMTNVGAQRVLLLLDSCKSGAVADAFENQKVFALLSRLAGIHMGAAATKEQNAGELKSLGHGLFTYALLKGIKGDADKQPVDGNITVKEILNYVKIEMPALIKKYGTPHQNPVINSRGMDFRIADTRN